MLGFTSIKGFISSLIGLELKRNIMLLILGASFTISAFIITLNNFIGEWIFFPPHIFWLVIWSYIIDYIINVYIAIRTKTFESGKAQRIIGKLIVAVSLLAFLFYLQRSFPPAYDSEMLKITFKHFKLTVALYISIINLLSFIATAGRNKLIDMKIVDFITKYVDTHKEQLLNKQKNGTR